MTAVPAAPIARRGRAVLLGFVRGLVLLVATLLLAAVLTARRGDPALFPAAADGSVPIDLVSHGYHSGLVLPQRAVAALAGNGRFPALARVSERFGAYPSIEFGWGEAEFYRQVPTLASVQLPMAARALFRPGNGSVLHVVGVAGEPRRVFDAADIVRLPLSPAGLERLLARLDAAFAHEDGTPVEIGPGLYGPSLFYRANGTFSILRVCNHWTADLLDAAGVPTAPVLATFPHGLIWDLRLRSGLEALPRPG